MAALYAKHDDDDDDDLILLFRFAHFNEFISFRSSSKCKQMLNANAPAHELGYTNKQTNLRATFTPRFYSF